MNDADLATRLSLFSAVLFATLVVLQIASGAAQHTFEIVRPAAAYVQLLIDQAPRLRVVIALDDLFIAGYVGATIFAALAFPRRPILTAVVVGAGIAAGLLDLEENHHMLALMRAAQSGIPLEPRELVRRMDWSSVKWVIGHGAFFLLAFLVPGRGAAARALRFISVFVQLPLGIAGVVFDGALALQLGRAVNLFAGFLLTAAVTSRLGAAAAGSGARASDPGTMPGVAG